MPARLKNDRASRPSAGGSRRFGIHNADTASNRGLRLSLRQLTAFLVNFTSEVCYFIINRFDFQSKMKIVRMTCVFLEEQTSFYFQNFTFFGPSSCNCQHSSLLPACAHAISCRTESSVVDRRRRIEGSEAFRRYGLGLSGAMTYSTI